MSVPCFQSAMLTGTGLASACALGYYAFTRAAHIAFFFFFLPHLFSHPHLLHLFLAHFVQHRGWYNAGRFHGPLAVGVFTLGSVMKWYTTHRTTHTHTHRAHTHELD